MKLLTSFLENMHGTDLALVAASYCIYLVVTLEGVDSEVAIQGIWAIAAMGGIIMIGRIFLTLVKVRKRKRPKTTRTYSRKS